LSESLDDLKENVSDRTIVGVVSVGLTDEMTLTESLLPAVMALRFNRGVGVVSESCAGSMPAASAEILRKWKPAAEGDAKQYVNIANGSNASHASLEFALPLMQSVIRIRQK
jgi:hypothetical protein